jgi:hypothetical protein
VFDAAAYRRRYYKRNKMKMKKQMREYYETHSENIKEQAKKTYRNNPEKHKEDCQRRRRLKYGWTDELYKYALESQDNRCAICKREFTETPNCDHKHTEPPQPRGLLCTDCNLSLGRFHENVEYLENAIAYLKKYNKDCW